MIASLPLDSTTRALIDSAREAKAAGSYYPEIAVELVNQLLLVLDAHAAHLANRAKEEARLEQAIEKTPSAQDRLMAAVGGAIAARAGKIEIPVFLTTKEADAIGLVFSLFVETLREPDDDGKPPTPQMTDAADALESMAGKTRAAATAFVKFRATGGER